MKEVDLKKRFAEYSADPMCRWVYHSEYFGRQIQRCYFADQPKALYRIVEDMGDSKGIIILGESLDVVKSNFRKVVISRAA